MTTLSPEQYKDIIKPKSKYRNIKTVINGIEFDSKGEAKRYFELVDLERMGAIADLKRQVKFTLQPSFKTPDGKTVREIAYVADFTYTERGKPVCDDFKGKITKEALLKLKMFKFKYPEYIFRISRKNV